MPPCPFFIFQTQAWACMHTCGHMLDTSMPTSHNATSAFCVAMIQTYEEERKENDQRKTHEQTNPFPTSSKLRCTIFPVCVLLLFQSPTRELQGCEAVFLYSKLCGPEVESEIDLCEPFPAWMRHHSWDAVLGQLEPVDYLACHLWSRGVLMLTGLKPPGNYSHDDINVRLFEGVCSTAYRKITLKSLQIYNKMFKPDKNKLRKSHSV